MDFPNELIELSAVLLVDVTLISELALEHAQRALLQLRKHSHSLVRRNALLLPLHLKCSFDLPQKRHKGIPIDCRTARIHFFTSVPTVRTK